VLRGVAGGALPGKSLVVYEPRLQMASEVIPGEDGHAQERSLLGQVLSTLAARDLVVKDRNFCVRDFVLGIAVRGASFICRQHKGLAWEADGKERFVGRCDSCAVYEQWVRITSSEGVALRGRRIGIVLKTPTRNGETDRSKNRADAGYAPGVLDGRNPSGRFGISGGS
jgi:hypothetical protein